MRTYEISRGIGNRWELKLYEDLEEMGGGVFSGNDDGYHDALAIAEEWVGTP